MRIQIVVLAVAGALALSGCGGSGAGGGLNLPAGIAWGTVGGTQEVNFIPVSGQGPMPLAGSASLVPTGYAYSKTGLTALSSVESNGITAVAHTYLLNQDGTSNYELPTTPCDIDPVGSLAWSPDETRLAYAFSVNGQQNIFTSLVAPGSTRVQITTAGADPLSPISWGTNGNIYYENGGALYSVAPDGNGSPLLVSSTSSWYPQISPDSTSLSFISTDRHKLYCKNLSSGTEQVILDLSLSGATLAGAGWMPDNQTLRYIKFAGQHSYIGRINSLTFAGSESQMPDTLNPGTLAVPGGSGVPTN